MNKEQPPAMEFVQYMEDMAVHGVSINQLF